MKERLKRYFKKLFNILRKPEMFILPSNIAFNLILALVPLLTLVVLVASAFDISIAKVAVLVEALFPKQVSDIIVEVISGKGFDNSVGLFNFVAFIIATNGTYAIISTSDALYKIKESNEIKKRLSAIIILLIIIILFVFLLVIPIFGENILELMHKAKILDRYTDEIISIFNIFKWPLTLFIVFGNIRLIYAVAPSKNIKTSETTYGAVFTTIMWTIVTFVFRFYLDYFARYDILYGNLSSIIILMVWVYLLSYIFTFGMAINVSRIEEKELEETQKLKLQEIQEAAKEIKKEEKDT